MLVTTGLLLIGLALLVFGADWFVKGAAGIASRFGVPPLVIGLTVVAYGTSMPELMVSAVASFEGRDGIAIGNVIGSNIANIGLILGVTALVSPPEVTGGLLRRELPMLLLATLAVPVVLFDDVISRIDGMVLLLAAVGFTVVTVRFARATTPSYPLALESIQEVREHRTNASPVRLIVLCLLGLAMLLLGGKWFVDAAVRIAEMFGVSERIIGLTVVALGTSLPELAASVVAALRGHAALAVGNVIGSNIFNVLLVLGAAAVIAPVPVDVSELVPEIALMIGFTVVAALLLRTQRVMSRFEGAVLTLGYVAAIVWFGRTGA